MKISAWVVFCGTFQLLVADFTLHIAHINDLWYQLEEMSETFGPCEHSEPSTTRSYLTSLTSLISTSSTTISSALPSTEVESTTESTTGTDYEPTFTFASTTDFSTAETDISTTVDSTVTDLDSTSITDSTSGGHTNFFQSSATDAATCFGGAERHKAKLAEIRDGSLSQKAGFLNLNAGNMIGEPTWLSIIGPEPAAVIAAQLGYHVMGLGHRDFALGVPVLAMYLQALKDENIPVVCANLDVSKELLLKDLIQPYANVNVTIAGKFVQVGVVGFFEKEDEFVADFGRATISDVNTAIKNAAKSLTDQGINTLIALGNAKLSQLESIARDVPDIDIVVGGGSNVFLYNGNVPSQETANGSYPYRGAEQKLYIVEVPHQGKYLGLFNATFDDTGKVKSYTDTNNPILLNEHVEATNLTIAIETWSSWVESNVTERLGLAVTPLFSSTSNDCWKRECPAGNLLTDAILDSFTNKVWSENPAAAFWPGKAFVVHNPSNGSIWYEDILTMLPNAYRLYTANVTGKIIRQLLEISVETSSDGRFLQVAGARVTYDMARSINRVDTVLLRNPGSAIANLQPLKDEASYLIVVPSIIANGGFPFLSNVQFVDTGLTEQGILRDYIKKIQNVNAGTEGRIQESVLVTPCYTDETGTIFLTIFLTLLFLGLIYLGYRYVWPKYRERRGSLTTLIR